MADGVVLEIEETQAQIVKRSFTRYANGWSLKRIAKTPSTPGVLSRLKRRDGGQDDRGDT